jgi:hypothetical protein
VVNILIWSNNNIYTSWIRLVLWRVNIR